MSRALVVAKTLAEIDDVAFAQEYSGSKIGDVMGRYLKAEAFVSILDLQVALGDSAAARKTLANAVDVASAFECVDCRSELQKSIARVARTMAIRSRTRM